MKHIFTMCIASAAIAALASAPADGSASGTNVVRKSGDKGVVVLPGGAKMEVIWCAPGKFKMGSPNDEIGHLADERIHVVTLTKGFWLGKYEVTQGQWDSVMTSDHSRFRGKNKPVENVSWLDCEEFIDHVNDALGGAARFPTEAEWEYACRAGSTAPFSGGESVGGMAWFDKNSDSHTHDVGLTKPNAWGFYDMHGNVLEWCSDWFSEIKGDAIDPEGPPMGMFKVLRGGCWFFFESDCRSANRVKREPNLRNCIFGLRLAFSDGAAVSPLRENTSK